ncbi:hypothetical protein EX30DRAFT_348606 [Ascodesmis nigricans]|uniref:Uncharacterized protein n=1 Tax=Ascodesmis nigricans TaxID=341454 RepID=A0A4S2MXI0_9PEZI|nr:hypothetical protein EX30DRAFT_348606 [Ascodesmis nigricans]
MCLPLHKSNSPAHQQQQSSPSTPSTPPVRQHLPPPQPSSSRAPSPFKLPLLSPALTSTLNLTRRLSRPLSPKKEKQQQNLRYTPDEQQTPPDIHQKHLSLRTRARLQAPFPARQPTPGVDDFSPSGPNPQTQQEEEQGEGGINNNNSSNNNTPAASEMGSESSTKPTLSGLKRNLSTRLGSLRGRRPSSQHSLDKARKAQERAELREAESRLMRQLSIRLVQDEDQDTDHISPISGDGNNNGAGIVRPSLRREKTLRRKQYEEMFGVDTAEEVVEVDYQDEVRRREREKEREAREVEKVVRGDLKRSETLRRKELGISMGGRPKEWRDRRYEEAFGVN